MNDPFADGLLPRALFDAVPAILFLLDDQLKIVFYNRAAADLAGEAQTEILRLRTGNALHCLNTLRGEECGTHPACQTCLIRAAMMETVETGRPAERRTKLVREKDGRLQDLFVQVKANVFRHEGNRYVLLALEDINPLVEIQRLIPICARCHKVRGGKDSWFKLEEYVRDQLGADFSHGYCPDCLKATLEEVERRYPGKREPPAPPS